jgi:hypothetical protein
MKIYIVGSMHFAKEMLEAQETLKKIGIESHVPVDTKECLENPELNMDDDHCIKNNIGKECKKLQEQCDAILVLNYEKEGVTGYIGAHTLIEMGLADYLGQKIFMLFPHPTKEEARYAMEVKHMKPIVLDGDISRIQEYVN